MEELVKVEECSIGDVVFMSIANLSKWNAIRSRDNTVAIDGMTQCDCLSDNNLEDFLIAVKYLGNGIFEEMTTHEKLISVGYGNKLEDLEYEDANDYIPFTSDYHIDFETMNGGKEIPAAKIAEILEKTKSNVENYPLSLFTDDTPIYYVTDDSKKVYLRHDDKERQKMILEAKKEALSCTKGTLEVISQAEKSILEVTPEVLDMADLENRLFDFQDTKKTI